MYQMQLLLQQAKANAEQIAQQQATPDEHGGEIEEYLAQRQVG